MLFAEDVLQHKIIVLKPLEPACFSLVQVMRFLIIEQVLVIGLHYYLVLCTCQIQALVHQGFNYCE